MLQLKPVNLNGLSADNLYKQNQLKLRILPWFSILGLCLCVFLLLAWYFQIFQFAFYSSESKNYQPNYSKINRQSGIPISENQISQVQDSNFEAKIFVEINIAETPCRFEQTEESHPNIKVNRNPQTFWVSNNCADLKIQVVKITEAEKVEIDKGSNEKLYQLQDSVYLILFGENAKTLDFKVDGESKNTLLNTTFQKKNALRQATAIDLFQVEDRLFYLTSECRNASNLECEVWESGNSNSDPKFIASGLGSLVLNYKENLGTKYQVKIAKTQDSLPTALNLLFYNFEEVEFSEKVLLVRVSIENGSLMQSILLERDTDKKNVDRYFR